MKNFICIVAALFALISCTSREFHEIESPVTDFSPSGLAKMFSQLPLDSGHLQEVFNAVGNSSGNGYDEEYTMGCLIESPGAGVGDSPQARTRAAESIVTPLRELIRDYLANAPLTRSQDTDAMLKALARTDFQLYWPYSENWDGETFPIITFDPGYATETNYGYRIRLDGNGLRVVDSVFVDEALAAREPVWVFNSNADASLTPLRPAEAGSGAKASIAPLARSRRLLMKTFMMKRQFDSWFGGASEFNIKCGSVEGFNATTDAELKMFYPSVTDFTIVVKRKYCNKELPYDAILVGDLTSQMDKLVFMVTEDDGGTRTSWKCDAVVKIQSKAYGFSVDLPYNERDDIVWRGQLSAHTFEEADFITGRFGDVVITFELE